MFAPYLLSTYLLFAPYLILSSCSCLSHTLSHSLIILISKFILANTPVVSWWKKRQQLRGELCHHNSPKSIIINHHNHHQIAIRGPLVEILDSSDQNFWSNKPCTFSVMWELKEALSSSVIMITDEGMITGENKNRWINKTLIFSRSTLAKLNSQLPVKKQQQILQAYSIDIVCIRTRFVSDIVKYEFKSVKLALHSSPCPYTQGYGVFRICRMKIFEFIFSTNYYKYDQRILAGISNLPCPVMCEDTEWPFIY